MVSKKKKKKGGEYNTSVQVFNCEIVYHFFIQQCLKQINNNYCGNSVGISCSDNSTQNCIVDDSDFEVENGLVLAIFAIPIASVALIICIIVFTRIVLKKKRWHKMLHRPTNYHRSLPQHKVNQCKFKIILYSKIIANQRYKLKIQSQNIKLISKSSRYCI